MAQNSDGGTSFGIHCYSISLHTMHSDIHTGSFIYHLSLNSVQLVTSVYILCKFTAQAIAYAKRSDVLITNGKFAFLRTVATIAMIASILDCINRIFIDLIPIIFDESNIKIESQSMGSDHDTNSTNINNNNESNIFIAFQICQWSHIILDGIYMH